MKDRSRPSNLPKYNSSVLISSTSAPQSTSLYTSKVNNTAIEPVSRVRKSTRQSSPRPTVRRGFDITHALPNEIFLDIFRVLDVASLLNLNQTSRCFRSLLPRDKILDLLYAQEDPVPNTYEESRGRYLACFGCLKIRNAYYDFRPRVMQSKAFGPQGSCRGKRRCLVCAICVDIRAPSGLDLEKEAKASSEGSTRDPSCRRTIEAKDGASRLGEMEMAEAERTEDQRAMDDVSDKPLNGEHGEVR